MANQTQEPVEARARRRLREIRTELGLTLQQIADRAHIDVSTLSRLESGKRRLTLDHLPGLAAALGVTLEELVGPSVPRDPRVRSRSRTCDGMTLWPLTHRGPSGGLGAYRIQIDPGRNSPPAQLPVHDGEDWLYVLDGRLRLVLGDEDLSVEPGEVVQFSTRTPHWFGALDGPVTVIAILGAQGERTHLHR
ncbi:MAG: helix-turn-helix transcriptional regulator [Actinobacteria bacterium]|nr:helix-turn-helix transcriptional regulator [Actinomycetota bacterium]